VIGQAAAGQTMAAGVKIYRHWKTRLLSNKPLDQEGKDALGHAQIEKYDERVYYDVGVTFFRQLRETIERMSLSLDLNKCPVRVCIPRLGKGTAGSKRMTDILYDAGWQSAANGATVFEPESNAFGVFTRGRNATWFPGHGGRCANYPKMFDQDGVFGAFRYAAQTGRDAHYGVLVIDLGAYTTDFGYVEFDQSFYDDDMARPDIIQLSCEIGVRELDQAVYDRMQAPVQKAISRISTTTWEKAKQLLYAGHPAAVRNPAGGILKIGEGAEAGVIKDVIAEFAERVLKAKKDFCRHRIKGPINAEVLTGGGAMIPLIRQALVKTMKTNARTRVYDLLDEEEPKHAILPKRDRLARLYYNPKEIDLRLRQNLDLVRGASAMGGCSVFFG
jgi:hypothetical protein